MADSCVKSFPMTGSFAQGAQFAEMTKTFHGGSRKIMRKNKKMNRRNNRTSRRSNRKMAGGAVFTPYADYQTEFSSILPKDMLDLAKVSSLDAAFAELPAVERAAGVMAGGGKRSASRKGGASKKNRKTGRKGGASKKNRKASRKASRKNRKMNGGSAPIDAPSMIIQTQAEELDARLNPQWYTENTVIPNFRGPIPIPGGTVPAPLAPLPNVPKVGGRRF